MALMLKDKKFRIKLKTDKQTNKKTIAFTTWSSSVLLTFWLSFYFFAFPLLLSVVPQEENSQSQYPQCIFLMTGAPAENIEIFNLTVHGSVYSVYRLPSQK